MRRPLVVIALCAAFMLAKSPGASAWSRQGHMVTAAIAYQELLRSDPTALRAALALLEQHPHFLDQIAPPRDWNLGDDDRGQAIFMRAARWAVL